LRYEGPTVAVYRNRKSLVERGARVWIELYAPEEDVSFEEAVPLNVEGPCYGDALVDTGAVIGAIDSLVVERLKLPVIRDISIGTTGGLHDAKTYAVGLRIAGTDVGAFELAGTRGLVRDGFIALLGRDFLAGRTFLYDGCAGTFSVDVEDRDHAALFVPEG
jgi:hypothetical protein